MTPTDDFNGGEPDAVPGLDESVASRIVAEVGGGGARLLRCLQTAHHFLSIPSAEPPAIRYFESAAYNLREALDSVVQDQQPSDGGLTAALAAWSQYKLLCSLPEPDEPTARTELAAALDSLVRDEQRQAFMTRKLLAWFERQTGVQPVRGSADPTVRYQRLRDRAANILHRESSYLEVQALYDDVIAWFAQFFAPPSQVVREIEALAELPFDPDRLSELTMLATTVHHLRLFLQRVDDPTWLGPMREVGLIDLPVPGEIWPVVALTDSATRLPPLAVVGLLESLAGELSHIDTSSRPTVAFELARTSSWLGEVGRPLILGLLREFPSFEAIQAVAMSAITPIDASSPDVAAVADAVVGNGTKGGRSRLTRPLVDRVLEGLDGHNVNERFALISTKLRRMDKAKQYRYLDIPALPDQHKENPLEDAVYVASALTANVAIARGLGMSTSAMLKCVSPIGGDLGERLTCQILAGAPDIDRQQKVSHLASRLNSTVATGDDRALVADLQPFDERETSFLAAAFGPPPKLDEQDSQSADSARAWRWSALLPTGVLAEWSGAIASVTELHGRPDSSAIDRPLVSGSGAFVSSSPIHVEEISELEPLDAARRIAAWRPTTEGPRGSSARELGRALEEVVAEAPEPWLAEPDSILEALREPIYIDHFLRGLKASPEILAQHGRAAVRAIAASQNRRIGPTVLGRDDFEYEPDWSQVDHAVAEVVRALANADAELGPDELDFCWTIAATMAGDLPNEPGSIEAYNDSDRHVDPLHGAINSGHGRGLQAVIALGGWEYRNQQEPSQRLVLALSSAVEVRGAVGLELRAVVAASRVVLEAIATDWINENSEVLFGDELGHVTLGQTLTYSRPTSAFLAQSRAVLFTAARRGEPLAVQWLVVAALWREPLYSLDEIVEGLGGVSEPMVTLGEELARLASTLPEERQDLVDAAVELCRSIMAEAGERIPISVVGGLGGLVLCKAVDDTIWLELTETMLEMSNRSIAYPTEIAERCCAIQPDARGIRVLVALLGRGDQWEQHHVDSSALAALRTAVEGGLTDPSVARLRERLIQRGLHEATSVL